MSDHRALLDEVPGKGDTKETPHKRGSSSKPGQRPVPRWVNAWAPYAVLSELVDAEVTAAVTEARELGDEALACRREDRSRARTRA